MPIFEFKCRVCGATTERYLSSLEGELISGRTRCDKGCKDKDGSFTMEKQLSKTAPAKVKGGTPRFYG